MGSGEIRLVGRIDDVFVESRGEKAKLNIAGRGDSLKK